MNKPPDITEWVNNLAAAMGKFTEEIYRAIDEIVGTVEFMNLQQFMDRVSEVLEEEAEVERKYRNDYQGRRRGKAPLEKKYRSRGSVHRVNVAPVPSVREHRRQYRG